MTEVTQHSAIVRLHALPCLQSCLSYAQIFYLALRHPTFSHISQYTTPVTPVFARYLRLAPVAPAIVLSLLMYDTE